MNTIRHKNDQRIGNIIYHESILRIHFRITCSRCTDEVSTWDLSSLCVEYNSPSFYASVVLVILPKHSKLCFNKCFCGQLFHQWQKTTALNICVSTQHDIRIQECFHACRLFSYSLDVLLSIILLFHVDVLIKTT